MKQVVTTMLSAVVSATIVIAAIDCKQDPSRVDRQLEEHIRITQEQLDSATLIVSLKDIGITGDPYHADYPDTSIAERVRDLNASVSKSDSILPGAIFVRRMFKYQNGVRGRLLNTTVMLKREAGFFTAGGDYEYMRIPFDPSTDYTKHPNGILPDISETTCRGSNQIAFASCVTCHAKPQTGPDRLFHR